MEENRNMPTWNSRKPISLESNSYDLKLMMNNSRECIIKSPKSRGDDGKGKEAVILGPEEKGRERLKRHREAMMGEVKIPENWGQEEKLLKTDYTSFDALFAPHRLIVTARDALIADVRKAARSSQRLRIHS